MPDSLGQPKRRLNSRGRSGLRCHSELSITSRLIPFASNDWFDGVPITKTYSSEVLVR